MARCHGVNSHGCVEFSVQKLCAAEAECCCRVIASGVATRCDWFVKVDDQFCD